VALTEGIRETGNCWRRHALWCGSVLALVAAILLAVGGYFFVENRARATENTDQNLQIVVVQTQLEHIRASLARIEVGLERERVKKEP